MTNNDKSTILVKIKKKYKTTQQPSFLWQPNKSKQLLPTVCHFPDKTTSHHSPFFSLFSLCFPFFFYFPFPFPFFAFFSAFIIIAIDPLLSFIPTYVFSSNTLCFLSVNANQFLDCFYLVDEFSSTLLLFRNAVLMIGS